jgi:protein O-GlcNAc transferase
MPSLAETIAVAMDQAARGRILPAIEDLRKHLPAHPQNAELHHALGLLVMRQGQVDQCLFHFERAATSGPPRADYLSNYATALNMKGRHKDAAEQFKKAVQVSPRFYPGQLGLASALLALHDFAGALDAARTAHSLAPGRPEAAGNLALALYRSGRTAEAVNACTEGLAAAREHPMLLTLLVNALNHRPEADPAQVLEDHKRLARIIQQLAPAMYPDFSDLTPDRPLRVAYLSSQFTQGGLAGFIAPLLENHGPEYQATCYSAVAAPDAGTKRLQKLCPRWVDVARIGDDALEHRVRTDRIDILVDLDGHTPGSRASALARRLAPVQMTWLGYPNTTAMKDVDYRLVDEHASMEGATEKPARLGQLACWSPSPGAAESGSRAGEITFVSCAPAERINERVVEAWSEILKQAAGSRLVLRAEAFTSARIGEEFASRFVDAGVDKKRLEFVGDRVDVASVLARGDIALDAFPVSGAAEVCDALCVGVPVVAMRSTRPGGQRAAGLLSAAGVGELVADSVEGYVELAKRLAGDRGKLDEMRRSLGERVRGSALCDAGAFVKQLEGVFRELWKARCG